MPRGRGGGRAVGAPGGAIDAHGAPGARGVTLVLWTVLVQIIDSQADLVMQTAADCALQLDNLTTCAQALAMMANSASHYFPSASDELKMQKCIDKLVRANIAFATPDSTLMIATLDLVTALVGRFQCHTLPAEDAVIDPDTIIDVVSKGLIYSSDLSLLAETRWLVAERCTRILLMCLHMKNFREDRSSMKAPAAAARNAKITELRRLVLRALLDGPTESPADQSGASGSARIQDFVVKTIAQSVRWISVLDRQFQPMMVQRYACVISNVLDITRLVLATPLADLQAAELFPLGHTRLPQRMFGLQFASASVGVTNDDNFSLIDEVRAALTAACSTHMSRTAHTAHTAQTAQHPAHSSIAHGARYTVHSASMHSTKHTQYTRSKHSSRACSCACRSVSFATTIRSSRTSRTRPAMRSGRWP